MMADPVRIEEVGPAFAPLLAGLHQSCFETRPEDAWSAKSISDMFAVPGLIALVASRGEDALGFLLARYVAGDAEILSVGVVPAARGQKLGEDLLATLHQLVAQRGTPARILLDVAADNDPARALYARAGYAEVGRRKAYYRRPSGVSIDSLTMCCDLD